MTSDPTWLAPHRPLEKATFERLRSTSGSLMRGLMNLEIEAMALEGAVLDVGGGERSSYASLLHGGSSVTTVNIDPEIRPTVVHDLAQPLPFDDAHFDTVISFNTLEHLADDQLALDEMVRVLRPGGRLHILVPFLYRVHGHPHDYHRHTAHGWNRMLNQAGLPDDAQTIRPLVWDPMSTGWSVAELAPLGRNWWRSRRFLRPWLLRRALRHDGLDRRGVENPEAILREYALAYAIDATKP